MWARLGNLKFGDILQLWAVSYIVPGAASGIRYANPAHEQDSESWCVPRPAVDQGPSVGSSIQGWPRIGSGSKVGCGSGGHGGLRAQGRIR